MSNSLKPNTLEHLMNDMIKGLSSKRIVLKVETKEKPLTNREEIINDSKLFEVRGYHLSDDTIYSAVKNFVDKEINSSIRNLEFSVKDAITYFPIDGTNFEIQTESPSKSNLAERYFKDKLKTYAERLIIDYLQGNVVIRNCPSELNFKVYTPSKINLTVVHPDYNFVKGEISAEKGDLKKVVYMLDKGQKIRIESAGDEKGRIE